MKTKTPAQVKQTFSNIPEGHYISRHSHDLMFDIYAQQDADTQKLLDEQPTSAEDYINRFIFWVRAIEHLSIEDQYNIVNQLVRAYAVHATMTDYHKAYRLVPDTDGGK